MPDLLAPLYRLPPAEPETEPDVPRVRLAMAYEREEVARFVRETWHVRWESEARMTFSQHPIRCHVAIADGNLVGFSCHDATFRGFFGPMGVAPKFRGTNTGKRLLLASLRAMRAAGYAYAIIGDVEEARGFYEKVVGATVISGSEPGAYEYDLSSIAPSAREQE